MGFADINSQIEGLAVTNPGLFYGIVIGTLVWKLIWYGLALYGTIEKKQKSWFVVLFIAAFVLNDLGVLPIIYLLINKKDKKARKPKKKRK